MRRTIEFVLLAVAVGCLGFYGWRMYEISRNQAAATETFDRARSRPEPAAPDEPPAPASVIGRLDIPRLHISAPIKAGDDDNVLDAAVGYQPDTPLPWQPGNSALAAHRDRLFRPLERIRVGDEIRLATTHGDLQYEVSRTLIVDPNDVWVLDPSPDANLTLITCFPFSYVGHAPKRFVVQARKIEPPL
jgi:sortase A